MTAYALQGAPDDGDVIVELALNAQQFTVSCLHYAFADWQVFTTTAYATIPAAVAAATNVRRLAVISCFCHHTAMLVLPSYLVLSRHTSLPIFYVAAMLVPPARRPPPLLF